MNMTTDTAEYENTRTKNCPLSLFDKCLRLTDDASAFTFFRMGSGPILISNIFLSAGLITLAEKEIGCYDVDIECGKVYGFKPSSIITNIGVVGGVLAALLLPFIGAIVDCTDRRRTLGASTAFVMIVIQSVQIATFQSTWLIMAILQAFNLFLFQVHLLTAYAYLPGIASAVGQKNMIRYSADYSISMFTMEVFYAAFCIGIASAIGLSPDNNEARARTGQIVNVVISAPLFCVAWYFFTTQLARRQLDEGESLVTTGFIQVFRTARGIKKYYGSTLGYFYLSVVFADAGHGSFAVVAVTYLLEVCQITGQRLGILLIIILLSTVPGSYFGAWVSNKTNPKISIQVELVIMIVFNVIAFLTLTSPEQTRLPFIYAACWGILLGWFYPTEISILSLVHPQGQESELSGIFLYCTQFLVWIPPLIFTIMNESDVHLKWGGITLNVFFLIGLVFFQLMAPWGACLDVAKHSNKMIRPIEIVADERIPVI